jgi:hypothetical protein
MIDLVQPLSSQVLIQMHSHKRQEETRSVEASLDFREASVLHSVGLAQGLTPTSSKHCSECLVADLARDRRAIEAKIYG